MTKGQLSGIIISGLIVSACTQEQHFALDESVMLEKPTYHRHSVEEILNASDDEELVRLSGEIVKKIKGKIYLFRGETGDINVVIDDSALPDERLKLNAPIVIKGEVDNPPDRTPRIEVDDIYYVF
ncbi:NirD/YgiW/YdeI family stress tolerance protein [Endozoicomonas sp. SCSIO W0465]|uniref:NirD/YgiW/YdeI family stress tolerance protein n=1 Tax=Endozoicomonas sp. SCSIO W0465 TaxID=2918516 RepID=UPI0020756D08|nr:NirD/YgiW/YdeI family stress tolerance protein [Endozoicomonas sp. SCSIO W0465]USE35771.1 NirD/YgiW/YdeI family stress tolerance protein [Endozoicomonas sp. SCSIO W0465]